MSWSSNMVYRTSFTRTAFLLSGLFVAACTVGEVPSTNVGNMGTDGGNPNGCSDRLVPPGDMHMHAAGGTSNAGMNCMMAGCHLDASAGAPVFSFAGTLYKTGGTTPNVGAAIKIKNGAGVTAKVYSDTGGNFYFTTDALAGTFPATVDVSACPTAPTVMVGPMLAPAGGRCATCHVNGIQGPITLAD